jgi:hypothetical protein
MFNFDEASNQTKQVVDGVLKSYSEMADGFQAIAAESGDYYKKSFQDMSAFMEALAGVRTVDAAYELQTSYAKSSYDGFVSQATKIGEMYAQLAKSACRPYETPNPKSTAVVVPQAA